MAPVVASAAALLDERHVVLLTGQSGRGGRHGPCIETGCRDRQTGRKHQRKSLRHDEFSIYEVEIVGQEWLRCLIQIN